MTTYSKETALYNTGAISTDIEEAGQTAERYITQVDSDGIKVHAQNNPTTNYSLINASGLTVYKGGNDVATFGDTARVGKSNSSRFLINSSSLQAYNSSNSKYFEVSSTGMTYGSNTVASTSYADGKASAAQSGAEATAAAALAGEVTRATAAESDAATKATNFLSVDNSGIMVYDGSQGAQAPSSPSANTRNVFIDTDSVDIRKGTTTLASFGTETVIKTTDGTELAHFGYAEGTPESGSTPTINPYYTFGTRAESSTVGNYSVAEGKDTEARGFATHAEGGGSEATNTYAHAEGDRTYAFGSASHTEGLQTKALYEYSHAEGNHSEANGVTSHAEGFYCLANGDYSHAQNFRTQARKRAQTAIGTWNTLDANSGTTHPSGNANYGKYALLIGNGTADDARSNALTVEWNGNVNAKGAFFANGEEFSKQADNHLVIGGYHVCWGSLTVSSPTLNAYTEQTVTLPYTYTSAPFCMASCAGRAARHRTAYASQGDQTGNKIRVGYYATASGAIYINYLTIGV